MSEQWTDERIAKEAALARVGSYNRTPVGWERMIEELLTQIRNDMQTEIDKRDAEIKTLRSRLDLTRKTLNAATKMINELRQQLIDVLDTAIARGEKLEYSDDDWREWYKELAGEDWQVAGGTWDNQEEQGE